MSRSMRAAVLAAVLLVLGSAAPVGVASAASLGPVTVVVLRVASGESLGIMFGRSEETLRLDGIRIPPCMAAEATARVYGLAAGRAGLLDYDRTAYSAAGELRGYLRVDGVVLNLVLVSEGYAVQAPGAPNADFDLEVLAAQRAAQAERLGLWGRCPPAEG